MSRGSLSPSYCSQATLKELKSKCALSPPCLHSTTSFNNPFRNSVKPWCLICPWSPAHSPQHSAMLVLEQESTLQSTNRKMGRARETRTSQARTNSTPSLLREGTSSPMCISAESSSPWGPTQLPSTLPGTNLSDTRSHVPLVQE